MTNAAAYAVREVATGAHETITPLAAAVGRYVACHALAVTVDAPEAAHRRRTDARPGSSRADDTIVCARPSQEPRSATCRTEGARRISIPRDAAVPRTHCRAASTASTASPGTPGRAACAAVDRNRIHTTTANNRNQENQEQDFFGHG